MAITRCFPGIPPLQCIEISEFQPFFRKLLGEVRLQGAEERFRHGEDKAAESLKHNTDKKLLAHISARFERSESRMGASSRSQVL